MAILDKRRTDQRTSVNSEPFWLSSATINAADFGKEIMLASFPKNNYFVLAALIEVITAFDAAATINIGQGTIATDVITTGGAMSVVDMDYYIPTADITEATIGKYPAASGAFVTALAAGTIPLIQGAAATVPTVYATTTNVPTVGSCKVHLLLAKVPTIS